MADEGKVTLFAFKFSPFAQRVQVALREKKIPFELIPVDLKNKPQELLDANPIHKKVPVIIHNGNAVAESLVILEYLEDAFPEQVPLLPKDAFEKSKVRFWVDYISKNARDIAGGLRAKRGSPEQQAVYGIFVTFLKTLDAAIAAFSADGPFFTGDKFGLVDVVLAPYSRNVLLFLALDGPPLPGPDDLPRFYRWFEAVKVHPSVSSSIASAEETVEYFRLFASLAGSTPAAAPQWLV